MLLLTQFLMINAHFTLNLLAALVFFAVAWLYFDAWLGRHDYREGTKSLGFILLSISFVLHATVIEQQLFSSSLLGVATTPVLSAAFRISAYITLIMGQVLDPIQPLPSYRREKLTSAALIIPLTDILPYSFPLLAISTAILYLHRATVGLEHHLKTISYSLISLALSDVFGLASTFRASSSINIATATAPFGNLWIVEHLLLLFAILILGRWVWAYLAKRLETQMLMILTTITLVIFLVTTIFFTSSSINSLRRATLANLETNANVLKYTLESKMAQSLSDAQLVAQNPLVIQAIVDGDKATLTSSATSTLLAKKVSTLVVTSETGEILIRADDPEKVTGSLSDNLLIRKAISGDSTSTVITSEGVLAPEISVQGSTPIRANGKIIGTVMVGTVIDNAFVDGLKNATGLDASVYAGNVRSATTFVAPDGKTRWIGIKEETEEINQKVLETGKLYSGSVNILNVPYFAAFSPLTSITGKNIGMLFVGTPQVALLESASDSLELTFLVTAGLLVLSIIPSFMISKYIVDQIV